MRLDPVFLVSPEPEKEPVRGFSRRAFYAAVMTALCLGAAAGRTLGVFLRSSNPETSVEEDATLRWALEAQRGDLATLVQGHEAFLMTFVVNGDARLQTGVRRIAEAVIADDPCVRAQRARVAERVLGVLRSSPGAEALHSLIGPLETCR